MPVYRCAVCGKTFDPEKNEICPRCGTIVAPSVLTQIERKQTAARLRADAMENDDTHCHEDDAWHGSRAAQLHRARAAAWHESAANGRNPYGASSANVVRADRTEAASPRPHRKSLSYRIRDRVQKTPILMIFIALIPMIFILLAILLNNLLQELVFFFDGNSYFFP